MKPPFFQQAHFSRTVETNGAPINWAALIGVWQMSAYNVLSCTSNRCLADAEHLSVLVRSCFLAFGLVTKCFESSPAMLSPQSQLCKHVRVFVTLLSQARTYFTNHRVTISSNIVEYRLHIVEYRRRPLEYRRRSSNTIEYRLNIVEYRWIPLNIVEYRRIPFECRRIAFEY